jgi:hypothetical protein
VQGLYEMLRVCRGAALALELTLGWMSSRFNGHPNRAVRRVAALVGWLVGFVPGSRGNYMTALIVPGRDLPPDPEPL